MNNKNASFARLIADVNFTKKHAELHPGDVWFQRNYFNTIYAATDKMSGRATLAQCDELCLHWEYMLSNTLCQHSISELALKEIDQFIAFVTLNKLVPIIESDTNRKSLLMCMCLYRIHLRDCGYVHPKENNVEDVLKHVFGSVVESKTLRSVAHALNTLYGEAYIALYQNDVPEIAQLPFYLWTNGLLGISHKKETSSLMPDSLPPCDFS